MKDINLLYIDLFCGAGGTSTGVENARVDGNKCAKVIACVNHDAKAIASHAANHPDALHFTEDIRTLELSPLIVHARKMRVEYPQAQLVLWASLECTNFSKAKGGQPRDADSRTLAEHLFRYIEALNPDYIQIENVEEFMSWGPMDDDGHPLSMQKGQDYEMWIRNVRKYGYDFDYRVLNAADYGAYTTRKRFFGIFARKGLPIVFPEATHCKDGSKDLFGNLKRWNPVKDVLDFFDEGTTIFRERKLSEKTLERIYAGLIKFVAGGKDKWILKYNSVNGNTGKHNPPSIDEPCPTVACQGRLGLVQCSFLSKQFSGDAYSKNISLDGPTGTITTRDHHVFVSAYYGNGHNHNVNEPCPAVTTTPKQNLITCKHYLMNPQFNSPGGSIDNPCFTLIAKMDKRPPYLIFSKEGKGYITIDAADSPMIIKIKEFMAIYGIVDIKMRMLKISELKMIMGFGADYKLVGTQADQKKFIGNAVEVNMARVLCEALSRESRSA